MAACPEETPKESRKISSENTVNHEKQNNSYNNELNNFSKKPEIFSEADVASLSEAEFLQLMIEASTFNKAAGQESALLRQLRSDHTPTRRRDSHTPPPTPRKAEEGGEKEQQGGSKFYVDCNDVDSTVSFPLKLVSSSEGGSEFPMVPWPRPLQVQSFFSSLPTDSFTAAHSDKQLASTDINGNPFSRGGRPSQLASFVSSALLEDGGARRKGGHKRRGGQRGGSNVLSQSIAGHRGEEDIDSLLQFINSSDKKAPRKAPPARTPPTGKPAPTLKESSLEDVQMEAFEGGAPPSPEPPSTFPQDLYAAPTEEPGFSVVVKRRQRKKQGKRSESYRWRQASQAQRKVLLPLGGGKTDARRKSTSSVPHSDPSSADNSDLDSVHSLPVRGSVPHPTRPHPHTTPSSSSSTPQASYADIARIGGARETPPRAATREINTQTEPEVETPGGVVPVSPIVPRQTVVPKQTLVNREPTEPPVVPKQTVASRELVAVSPRDPVVPKQAAVGRDSPKKEWTVEEVARQPPVIMAHPPPACLNVSFGFGVEEVLREGVQRVCYGGHRDIGYSETAVNAKRFNHAELTRFFEKEFFSIEKEINGGVRGRYYVASGGES